LFSEKYKLTGFQKLIIVDIAVHLACFLYVLLYLRPEFLPPALDMRFLTSLAVMSAYMITFDAKKVYNIGQFEMLSVFLVANMLYLIMFVKK
jgi:hypothetical protein